MKTSILLGAALATLGVAVAPVSAQTQTTSTTTGYVQTSKIVGTKVKTAQGEEVGVIKDVVLDRNTGCMAYTVLSAGGTGTRVTGTAKTVAVPWAVYSTTSDPSILTVRVDRERIYNAPVFEYSRIDEYSTSSYINNVYSYYGVSANVGVGAQGSVTGTTTTTGAATSATGGVSTTATASPMASASPAAAASPSATALATASPLATASASPSATASASPVATASASPTAKARRGTSPSAESPSGKSKTGMTPASSRHTETTTGEKGEETKAGSAASPSSDGKKVRRRATEEGSTAEPSVTPKTTEEQE